MTTARRRPRQRLKLILLIGFVLGVATALSAYGLRDYATYFRSPTDIHNQAPSPQTLIRVGGMVVEGSFKQGDDKSNHYSFQIGDGQNILDVTYDGILPDLFREKQGIVIEGYLRDPSKPFEATRVLAKHDEYYMPAEVKRAMEPKANP